MINDTEQIVNEFYPIYGSKICIEKTGLKKHQIYTIAKKLNLKVVSRSAILLNSKKNSLTVFNPEPFLNIKTKEVAYLLGFIWADGSLGSNKKCGIYLEILEEDMNEIKSIIKSTGNWRFKTRQRNNWKPVTNAHTNNRKLYEFLIDNNYGIKSTTSPDKILSKIPENLKHYFFRGLIDGDGCFYINEKQYLYQFSITSTINQNWKFFSNLLQNLDIKFDIQYTKKINKKSKNLNSYSCLRITNKNEILKFGNYIYSDLEFDKIGLQRKYKKYNLIKEKALRSKFQGIYAKPNGKFDAYGLINGKYKKYIGRFSNKENAIEAQKQYHYR
jgi:hypothetical protein